MPSVEEVLRAVIPGAVDLTAGSATARPVNWVRVMRPRVPAFDALEPADIAVVPEAALAAIARDDADATAAADELRRADVAGVVLVPAGDTGPGDRADESSAAFLAAATRIGLTVFRSPEPADDLERELIRYLVNARAEFDRQIARLEAELQQAALDGRGVQGMAAAIAGFFRRAVAIEGSNGSIVAVHAPPGSPAGALAAARYEGHGRPAALRRELPGGGSLVLLGESAPSELEEAAAERVAVLLALELARDPGLRRGRDHPAETLPAAGPPWVVLMARQAAPGDATPIEARDERRRLVMRLAPARRLLLRGDAASVELRAVAAATPDDPLGLELAHRVAGVVGRPVAVSRPFDDATARPQADAEARAVLEAADQMAALGSPPSVVRADRLGMYRLLGSLHNLPDGERHARTLLAPVLGGSARHRLERLATLQAIVDGAGPAEAAASLGVHRNTVAYRIRSLERVTGWDLSDKDLRLALAIALRVVRNA